MKSKLSYALLAVTVALATLAIAQNTPSVAQTVPRLVKFSGKLANSQGKPASDVAGVTFSLYKVQEGGVPLWMETQNVHPDATGRYTVTLGETKPNGIPAELFASGEAQWLGIRSQDQSEQPRVLLMSVPYALKALDAETIGGKPASAFALADPVAGSNAPKSGGTALTQSTSRGAPPVSGTGTPGYIARWATGTNLGNSTLFQKNGNIGLGTTNPTTSTGGRVLDIENPSGPSALRLGDASTGGAEWEWQSTVVKGVGAMNLSNLTNLTNPLTVSASGYVGIGTTDPSSTLNVQAGKNPAVLATSDAFYGVYGLSHAASAAGTVGVNDGGGIGVTGSANGKTGQGVFGESFGSGFNQNGGADGVQGRAHGTSGAGVSGVSMGGNIGVYGTAQRCREFSPCLAGQFDGTVKIAGELIVLGDVNITGNLIKGSGSFKIDHPLDPANKYLSHSFVESPDMMNVYNGNIVTDKSGVGTVVLPSYFEGLNRDFRYQVTVVGQFAQAIVAKKVIHNRFTIKTSKPGVEVSWQITGIRQDAYANAHRIPVEEGKSSQEQGRYLHPELFGAPREQAIGMSVPAPTTTATAQREDASLLAEDKPQ